MATPYCDKAHTAYAQLQGASAHLAIK